MIRHRILVIFTTKTISSSQGYRLVNENKDIF